MRVAALSWGSDDWKGWAPPPPPPLSPPPLAQKELAAGGVGRTEAFLATQPQHPVPDVILLADCVYWPVLFSPLIETLRGLLNGTTTATTKSCSKAVRGVGSGDGGSAGVVVEGTGATVLMAHTRRWKKVRPAANQVK